MTVQKNKPKLIYIAGSHRSGTTLLASLLAEAPGSLGIGEPVHLWDKDVPNLFCSCGEKLADCEFWSGMSSNHYPGKLFFYGDGLKRPFLSRSSQAISILLGRGNLLSQAVLEDFRKFYSTILEGTNESMLIDESKYLPYLLALNQTGLFDLRVIYIVRDPRAVAFSWQRRKKVGDRSTRYIPWYTTARRWLIQQTLFPLIHRRVPREDFISIRYEDFIKEPRAFFERITGQFGVEMQNPFTSDSEFTIQHTSHLIQSNITPPRLGTNHIIDDNEWQSTMPFIQKLGITLICWPMMLLHGYSLFD